MATKHRLSPRQVYRLEQQMDLVRSMREPVPFSCLDLGVERGLTGKMLRALLPDAWIVGVEGHRPTWERIPSGVYDKALCSDALRFLRDTDSADFDLVVAAELVEHYDRAPGFELLSELERFPYAIATSPIGFMPQGEIDGNPLQIHRSGWTPQDFTDRGWAPWCVSPEHSLGVYAWFGTAS